MPIICRLLAVRADQAATLGAQPAGLTQAVESAKIYSDVYRYWHAIEYLLAQHSATSVAGKWLRLGEAVSPAAEDIPAARVIAPAGVKELDAALRPIEPDDLIPHYEADALDQAGVYPRTWVVWEETFDPLGQVLEHYSFLREFAAKRAAAGDALLLYFVFVDEGSV